MCQEVCKASQHTVTMTAYCQYGYVDGFGAPLSSGYTRWVTKRAPRARRRQAKAAGIVPRLVADVFHLAGAFRRRGEAIAGQSGRTQAEWQLLSAVSDGARTVPQIARRLGYTRQSVQRTADHLHAKSLVRFTRNPDHKKSALVEMTGEWGQALDRMTRAADDFHRELASQVDFRAVVEAEALLRKLCDALDPMTR